TGALQQVGPVQPGGRHANTNLPYITGRGGLLRPLRTPFNALQCLHAASIVHLSESDTQGRLLHCADGTWRPERWPNMRYQLSLRRVSMKRSLLIISTLLALSLG